MRLRLLLPLLITLAGPAGLSAAGQRPTDPPAPPPPATPPSVPSPPPNYVYAPDGRRDPFVSLFSRSTEKEAHPVATNRPDGVAGIGVGELVLRGLVESRGGWLAMIGTPSGKTYSIRPGDRLFDGTVTAITADALVLMQDINDPPASKTQREVRKYLRGEGK
jgi:Tfp pilus assembly protein PilP